MKLPTAGNSAGTAVTFLLIGLGAGALLGLLLAPKPGKQLRKDLRKKYDSARETVEDWTDDAKEFAEEAMERGAEIADEVRERVSRWQKPCGGRDERASDLGPRTSDFDSVQTSDSDLGLWDLGLWDLGPPTLGCRLRRGLW